MRGRKDCDSIVASQIGLPSHYDNNFDPPADDSWSFHSAGYAPPPVGLSLWLVRRCGTPCRTTRVILLLAEIHLGNI